MDALSTEQPHPPAAFRRLADGSVIPAMGVGTFGSDRYDAESVARAVEEALSIGFRLVDCASVYGNESRVGEALRKGMAGGIARADLFVMSKIWNDAHEPSAAIASVEASLADLGLDHLDAVFVHWPFPNHHAPFADTAARDPRAVPYIHDRYMATWAALETLVDRGLVRHLGTSNMTIPKLTRVVQDARIRPALNEMESHPCFPQSELFRFCVDHGIQPIAYSPLGSPSRPERDRTPDDVSEVDHHVVRRIADAHGVHPASICLAWAVQRGQIPIPFAVKSEQIRANLVAASIHLSPVEIDDLDGIAQGDRLIKGQVFLWPGSEDWRDLWDVDGSIPGWSGYGSPEAVTSGGHV